MNRDRYSSYMYRIADNRVYDVEGAAFPRITPLSFLHGEVPSGTLRLSYSIDLTNDPPTPLSPVEISLLLAEMSQ
jgi:hypothetical protein